MAHLLRRRQRLTPRWRDLDSANSSSPKLPSRMAEMRRRPQPRRRRQPGRDEETIIMKMTMISKIPWSEIKCRCNENRVFCLIGALWRVDRDLSLTGKRRHSCCPVQSILLLDAFSHLYKRVCPSVRMRSNLFPRYIRNLP